MKLVRIENISNENVQIKHKNGAETTLPPGVELKNVDIANLDEIKGKTSTIIDLTEVTEHQGKTQLRD